jgi:manganese-dependent inorganic pyrophosphatase
MTNKNILIGETIYIVGHTKPDVDAIVSAYAYQVYRHARGDFNYIAIRCDKPNTVTEWIFKETGFEMPRLLKSIAGQKVVFVDHTDPEQRAPGWEEAEIIEVFDHHKLKLETSSPPKITVRPYGSTTTIVAEKMLGVKMTISPKFAQLMLSAILDDTLALRSPITTFEDKIIAGELAAISGLGDIDAYAKKMFGKKDVWHRMKVEKIVGTDTKRYTMGNIRIGITQVETMDNFRLEKRIPEIQSHMKSIVKKEKMDLFIVMLTDVIEKRAWVLSEGEHSTDLEEIFGEKFDDRGILNVEGMLSRKKQMVPPLVGFYGKNE